MLIEREEYYPGFIFRSASPILRDKLFEKLWNTDDSLKINHLLSALAWIGDEEVVNFFVENAITNLFDDHLCTKMISYTKVAGWELNQNNQKRLLYFEKCYPLIKKDTKPSEFLHKTFQSQMEECQGCGNKLMSLIKFDLSDKRLNFINLNSTHLNIGTCLKCDDWSDESFFTKIDHNGQISRYHKNKKPVVLSDETFSWCIPGKNFLYLSGETRSPYYATIYGDIPIGYSQFGGFPTWIQDEVYPLCPECKETMTFVGQIANEDCEEFSEGIHYFFLCSPCMITSTVYQQT